MQSAIKNTSVNHKTSYYFQINLNWNVRERLRQVERLNRIPIVQVLSYKHRHLHWNCKRTCLSVAATQLASGTLTCQYRRHHC